jgi:hypothetical protein
MEKLRHAPVKEGAKEPPKKSTPNDRRMCSLLIIGDK